MKQGKARLCDFASSRWGLLFSLLFYCNPCLGRYGLGFTDALIVECRGRNKQSLFCALNEFAQKTYRTTNFIFVSEAANFIEHVLPINIRAVLQNFHGRCICSIGK